MLLLDTVFVYYRKSTVCTTWSLPASSLLIYEHFSFLLWKFSRKLRFIYVYVNTALSFIPRGATLWFRKPFSLYWSEEISVRAGRSGVTVLLIFLLSTLPENEHCLNSSWPRKYAHSLCLGVTGEVLRGCAYMWIPFCTAIFWYFIMSDCAALESWSCRAPWMNHRLFISSVCIILTLSPGKPQQIAQPQFSLKSHVCIKEMKTKILMSSLKQKGLL